MKHGIIDFYENPNFTQDFFVGYRGEVSENGLHIPNNDIYVGDVTPQELEEPLGDNIGDLYDSIQRLCVTQNGYEYVFEVGIIEGTGDKVELRVATYQSSLTGNLGNAFEVAAGALDDPTKTIIYVASLGMGLSTAISPAEQRYLKDNGTLLVEQEDGSVKPLPVVKALARGLNHLGYIVTDLGSDSAGALLTMAYGAAYGKGNIERVHQNVRTGVQDMGVAQLGKAMMWDDRKFSQENAKLTPDALAMSVDEKGKLAFVAENQSDVYKSKVVKPKKSVGMLAAYAVGLGRGPKQGDPLLTDNIALAKANPGARVLFTFGSNDPLVAGVDMPSRLAHIARETSTYSEELIMATVLEGGNHGIQTHFPQALRRIAKTALNN